MEPRFGTMWTLTRPHQWEMGFSDTRSCSDQVKPCIQYIELYERFICRLLLAKLLNKYEFGALLLYFTHH